jgi:hypothetical protein
LWEVSIFIGITALLLAGYALTRRDPRRRFALVVIVTSLLLALGYHTPLFKLLYYYLPGFNTFRVTAKFTVPAVLFLAMLAGLGLDQLTERAKGSARPVFGFAIAAALFLLCAFVVRGAIWSSLLQTILVSGESSRLPALMLPESTPRATWSSSTGKSTMNAAPRNAPATLPSPPMMMMNRTWNERVRSSPCGSTVPR